MTFRIRSLAGMALTAAILAFQTGAAHAQETVVKVGVAVPLTGSGAAYGKDIEMKGTRYDGITGTIAFTNTGDLKNPSSTLYEVKNAAWQPVTTQTAD